MQGKVGGDTGYKGLHTITVTLVSYLSSLHIATWKHSKISKHYYETIGNYAFTFNSDLYWIDRFSVGIFNS